MWNLLYLMQEHTREDPNGKVSFILVLDIGQEGPVRLESHRFHNNVVEPAGHSSSGIGSLQSISQLENHQFML